jgi:hypothetical protein
MTTSGKNTKQDKVHKTKLSIPYNGKNKFIEFHQWTLENMPYAVHIDVDLSRRAIDLIVNNTEDAMTIFIQWA